MENDMEIIDVYVVHPTTDERGSKGKLIGVFDTQENAESAATDRGWYGGMGSIDKKKGLLLANAVIAVLAFDPVVLNDNLPEITEAIKQAGLKKLTFAEKRALGLEGTP